MMAPSVAKRFKTALEQIEAEGLLGSGERAETGVLGGRGVRFGKCLEVDFRFFFFCGGG